MSKKIIPSADTYFSRPGNTLTVEAWEVFKANNPRSEYTCETCWHIHDGMLIRNKPLNDTAVTKKVLIKAGIYFTGEFDRIRITSDLHGKVILVVDYEDDNLLLQLEAAGAKVIYITSNPNYDKNTPDLYFTMYPENYTANDYPAEDRRNIFIGRNIEVHSASFYGLLENITNLLKELNHMKIDLVIANPPYGAIGANITKKIIDTVDFKEYINLLPLKDYDLNVGRHIDFNSVLTCPPHSFGDADILTHAVKITKKANDAIKTETDLVATAFTVDLPMIKFMRANELKCHYAIDNISGWKSTDVVDRSFCFHEFRAKSQHTCGMDQLESKSVANEYNFNNNEIKEKTVGISGCLAGAYYTIKFNTVEEKQHFVEFYKINRNFINRMIANQFIGVRDYSACWPKVDWTRSDWTVEKILKEVANYSDEEVKVVIDTLSDRDWVIRDDASIKRLFGEWMTNETK